MTTAVQGRPWLPASLRLLAGDDLPAGVPGYDQETVQRLRYVEVDEKVGRLVCLAVSPWPVADEDGRLRFDVEHDRGHVVVHAAELSEVLYKGWLQRALRVGDVFAAEVAPAVERRLADGEDVVLDERLRLVDVLCGAVHDVSADARTVAKLAFYAASAPCPSVEDVPDAPPPPERGAPTRRLTPGWDGAVVPAPAEEAAAAHQPPWSVPESYLEEPEPGAFVEALRAQPDALVYFLLNVGDGDTQLLLLPADPRCPHRRAVVVDVATVRKLPALLQQLEAEQLLPPLATTAGLFPLVVGTHPHEDHIGGMPELLDRYGRAGQVSDFWEPGYYHPSGAFTETMVRLEELGTLRTQPTSGTTRWVGTAKVTVLAPGVGLRTRFDSYGVGVNDASLALRVEFPAVRVAQAYPARGEGERRYLRLHSPWALLLGADAQTTSWAQVSTDFPQLHRQYDTGLYEELAAARGRDHLAADVLKVPHHASKHGVNLELVERISPQLALVSSVGGRGKYGFPHDLATEAVREALERTTSTGRTRSRDHDLGLHYTGSLVEGEPGTPVGSVAVLVPPRRSSLQMWRFGDAPRDEVDLSRGRRVRRLRAG